MKAFGNWLSSGSIRKVVPPKDYVLISTELENNEVAVKASNVFPISYSMLASVINIKTLTYFQTSDNNLTSSLFKNKHLII